MITSVDVTSDWKNRGPRIGWRGIVLAISPLQPITPRFRGDGELNHFLKFHERPTGRRLSSPADNNMSGISPQAIQPRDALRSSACDGAMRVGGTPG